MSGSDPAAVAAQLRALADKIAATDPAKAQLYRDKADLQAQAPR